GTACGCTLCGSRRSDPGRGGVTAATLDSKSSAREGVRVQLPPPVPFLDNIPQRLVGWSLAWGCSSVGRAQGWQSWGQGFESPQLHQLTDVAIAVADSAGIGCRVFLFPHTCRAHRPSCRLHREYRFETSVFTDTMRACRPYWSRPSLPSSSSAST